MLLKSSTIFLLLTSLLPSPLLAGQICRPAGGAATSNSDQSPEVPYGILANALFDECSKSGAMQKGFSAQSGGWYGRFTGCKEMGSACTDILGKKGKGGQGGDYQKMIDSCKTDKPPANKYRYQLAASPDQKFHGGMFEHIFDGTKKACGLLIVDRGAPK